MPQFQKHRFDELPMDRRIAGEARGVSSDARFGAVYERREIDPTAPHVKRRTGTKRVANAVPNLLGASYNGAKGSIVVDRDFTSESGASSGWSIFGTIKVPNETNKDDKFFRILNFADIVLYIRRRDNTGPNTVTIAAYDSGGALINVGASELSLEDGENFHFFASYDNSSSAQLRLNFWRVSESPTINADNTSARTFTGAAELKLLGKDTFSLGKTIPGCVINNIRLFDNDDYTTSNYNQVARSTDESEANLLWQALLSDGGNILTFGSTDSYLIPTSPEVVGATIRFGGLGVIEIPFYLDFDEYFWTTTNAAARLNWCFQLKAKLPSILKTCTLFELQDLARLQIIDDSGTLKLQATLNDGGSVVTSSVALVAGSDVELFVARDTDSVYLKVGSTETSGSASNPIVYNYDKTIGFVVGDRVDFENSDAFGGQIELFAFHNNETREFQLREDAVLFYDVNSIQGDEVLDRGNRALNGFLGVRAEAQAPFYREGAFPGGAYVAACGGYLVSNAKPAIGYEGELRKPLSNDVVIQRRGRRAFLTSNGVNYIVDDRTKSIRPLGIPRPSTKVSAVPQGVGPIDGFVRYAYRFVSIDGTVGPVFELDPCDATGGVNVFLGAEAFGNPSDPAFGLSFGEVEKDKLTANDEVECFLVPDKDSTDAQLLHKEFPDGLTLEAAFRLPELANTRDDLINSFGVYAPPGRNFWAADNAPVEFPWIGKSSQECCFQFTFRYKSGSPQIFNGDSPAGSQTLFCIGNKDQKYRTGGGIGGGNVHWRCQSLYVSIQPPANSANDACIVVCRNNRSLGTRDNALRHVAQDVTITDGHDYSIFVQRKGASGTELEVALYDHTDDTWENWPPFLAEIGARRQAQ